MTQNEFRDALIKLTALYVTNANGYDRFMDELASSTTRAQWAYITQALDLIDTTMVEHEVGTVSQMERYLAQEEQRESRYPAVLFVGDSAERERRILALEREFATRGLRVQPCTYRYIDPTVEPERAPVLGDPFGMEYMERKRSEIRSH